MYSLEETSRASTFAYASLHQSVLDGTIYSEREGRAYRVPACGVLAAALLKLCRRNGLTGAGPAKLARQVSRWSIDDLERRLAKNPKWATVLGTPQRPLMVTIPLAQLWGEVRERLDLIDAEKIEAN